MTTCARTPFLVLLVVTAVAWTSFGVTLSVGAANILNVGFFLADNNTFKQEDEVRAVSQWWEDIVNHQIGGIVNNGTTYTLSLVFIECGTNRSTALAAATAAIAGDFGPIDFFFAPTPLEMTMAIAELFEAAQKLLITSQSSSTSLYICAPDPASGALPSGCQRAGQRRFRNLWSTAVPAENTMQPIVHLAKLAGAKTLATFSENTPTIIGIINGTLDASYERDMTVVYNAVLTSTASGNPDPYVFEKMVDALVDAQPDLILGGTTTEFACTEFIKQLKARNYVPKMLALRFCITNETIRNKLGNDARYIVDYEYFDPRLTGPNYQSYYFLPHDGMDSPRVFYEAYRSRFGDYPNSSDAPRLIAGCSVLHQVIEVSRSLSVPDVDASFDGIFAVNFYGKISFDWAGRIADADTLVTQMHVGGPELIYPLSTSTSELVYPFPEWDQREEHIAPFNHPAEFAITAICGLFILAAFVLLGVMLHYREEETVRAASPPFLAIMLVGAILFFVGIIIWSMNPTDAQCMLFPWFIGLGFIGLFGALFAKTWRIVKIFSNISMHTAVGISNFRLLLCMLIMIGFELIILVLWTSSSAPLKSLVKIPDPFRPANNYRICDFNDNTLGYFLAFMLIKGVLVVWGLVQTIRIWGLQYDLYNESKQISFSMYNSVIFIVLTFIAMGFIPADSYLQYVVRSSFLIISTGVSILTLFIPMLYVASGHSWGSSSSTPKSQKRSWASSGGSIPVISSRMVGSKWKSWRSSIHQSMAADQTMNTDTTTPTQNTTSSPDETRLRLLETELEKVHGKYRNIKEKYKILIKQIEATPSLSSSTDDSLDILSARGLPPKIKSDSKNSGSADLSKSSGSDDETEESKEVKFSKKK